VGPIKRAIPQAAKVTAIRLLRFSMALDLIG